MYVLNARDKDMITFLPPVQKYLLENGIPMIKRKGNTRYFRRSNRLRATLTDAPLFIRLMSKSGKEV